MKFCFPWGLYNLTKVYASSDSTGLHNLPLYLGLPLTIIIFDFAIYWQHRLSHKIKIFWRFHKVHHCDQDMDFSSALRFHPGEIVLSGLLKLFIISIITPRAESYLFYETVLVSMAIFNHSNFYISDKTDKFLRYFIVTPNMHYPHHSPIKEHTNSNYGNFLSIWDRLFKTYNTYSNSNFGLEKIKRTEAESFKALISMPFK